MRGMIRLPWQYKLSSFPSTVLTPLMVTTVTGAQPERRGQKKESQPDLVRVSLIEEQRKDPVIAYMLRSKEDDREPDPRSPSAELREYLSLWNGLSNSMDKDGLLWYSYYLEWDTAKTHVLCLPQSLQKAKIAT